MSAWSYGRWRCAWGQPAMNRHAFFSVTDCNLTRVLPQISDTARLDTASPFSSHFLFLLFHYYIIFLFLFFYNSAFQTRKKNKTMFFALKRALKKNNQNKIKSKRKKAEGLGKKGQWGLWVIVYRSNLSRLYGCLRNLSWSPNSKEVRITTPTVSKA